MSTIDISQDLAELYAAQQKDDEAAAQARLGEAASKPPVAPGSAPKKVTFDDVQGPINRWAERLPRNITLGLFDSAVNTWETLKSGFHALANGDPENTQGTFTAGMYTPPATAADRRVMSTYLDHAKADSDTLTAIRNFREHLSKNDSPSDAVTQGVAQFAVPFMGWSKLFNGFGAASKLGKVAQLAGAETATATTAFDPHAGRFADLYSLGQHTEGKLGDALNAVAPDGSLMNEYINYMTDRGNESEAEGRFKNAVDNLTGSAAIAGLLKTGALTFKAARATPEYIRNITGAPGAGDGSALELPSAGQGRTLADILPIQGPTAAELEAADQAAARRQVQAQSEVPAQMAPTRIDQTPDGHTVVVAGKPLITFLKPEDAQAAVADAQNMLGRGFEHRLQASSATLTDKNFDTLHTFSRVLQQNVDRPASTHSLVTALEQNLKGDTEQGAFYKELLGRLREKQLGGTTTVSSKGGRHENSAGFYEAGPNAITIYPKAFQDSTTLLHTFTHEAVHAATIRELAENPGVYRKLAGLFRTVENKRLADALNPASNVSITAKKPYGMTDPKEFVAEIEANPAFRKEMQNTMLANGEQSVWDAYKKVIAGILGLSSVMVASPEFDKLLDPKQETPSA